MIAAVERRKDDLMRLCLRYKVKWLDLFGSTVSGEYDPNRSDLDFLVEFHPEALALEVYADRYFGVYEDIGVALRTARRLRGGSGHQEPVLLRIS